MYFTWFKVNFAAGEADMQPAWGDQEVKHATGHLGTKYWAEVCAITQGHEVHKWGSPAKTHRFRHGCGEMPEMGHTVAKTDSCAQGVCFLLSKTEGASNSGGMQSYVKAFNQTIWSHNWWDAVPDLWTNVKRSYPRVCLSSNQANNRCMQHHNGGIC